MLEQLGRYEILEPIGEGGFAVVYKGRDTALDRLVALKELRPLLLKDKSWVKRFQREARTIASLDHPHIVPIYDVHDFDDRLFIVMRLVDSASLEQIIYRQGPMAWNDTLRTLLPITAGLHYAHDHNILHRDLKPANILLDSERGPMLSDFGLARMVGEHSMSMTESGTIVGTPHYIAPEMWEGKGATHQSDIYALGCILYEMLTGEKIFKGETPPAVMMAHFKPLSLPAQWPDAVPPGIDGVLRQALAQKPAERYASVQDLAQDLASLSPEMVNEFGAGFITGQFQATAARSTPTPPPDELLAVEPPHSTAAPTETPPPSPPDSQSTPAGTPGTATPPTTAPSTPTPTPQPGHQRSGCLMKSTLFLILIVAIFIGLTSFCAAFGGSIGNNLEAPVLETFSSWVAQNIEITEPITETVAIPIPADSESTRLEIDVAADQFNLTSGAHNNLIEGVVTYNVDLLKPKVVTTGHNIMLGHAGNTSDLYLLILYDFVRTDIQNSWNLKLGNVPLTLSLNTGTAQGIVELGPFSLVDLVIKQGAAATLDLSFTEPNQIEMNTFEYSGSPTKRVAMSGLANTRAQNITLTSTGGDYLLDFSGQLQNDIEVRIEGMSNSFTITVPEGAAARLEATDQVINIDAAGRWQRRGQAYELPGQGYHINIALDMDTDSLKLRN